MAADAPVLVVGAGPTGLLLAAELQRRGIGCRLIDAQPGPMHWDRATVVHPRSLEVFESLGILGPFLAAGVKQRAARLHSQGRLLGEIDLSTCGSRHGYNLGLSEEVTESILTDYLRQQGGEVIRSHRLVTLEHHQEGVIAGIECDGSREQVSFQWVVGCDGLHSITRQLAGIGLAGHDIPEPWAVFDATASGWPEAFDANYAYLDEIPVIMTALPDHRWRVYLRPSSPDSDLVVDAALTIGRYHREVALNDISNPNRFHCHTKVATQFKAGPILLAGDAAHVCSPSQGHGMNSGVQDAFNLAWKLALVCGGDCSTKLLDSYEAERRPVAEMITRSGDQSEHAHTLTDPAERRARDKTLRSVFADPELRHQEVIAEAELDIDYGDSPIVMGDTNEALNPGQTLPDTIQIQRASGEVGLLHDLTNRTGHTALLIGGSSSHQEDLARLNISVRSAGHPSLLEATIVATTQVDDHEGWERLDLDAADRLGVTGVTLLAVRPDGYIGLRADRDHLEALATYQPLLGSRPSGGSLPIPAS
jgi:2-polyprenyl-6-methoxyphenol hydroxylase-like FAD-dependent oxidoreductase